MTLGKNNQLQKSELKGDRAFHFPSVISLSSQPSSLTKW